MTSFVASTSVPANPEFADISTESIRDAGVSTNGGRNSTPPSPSPSTSSFALLDNKAAYTHPYAIKTTSTALLSRSGSNAGSPHRVNEGKHRYIPPPSPSPTEGNGNSAARLPKRGARHRYSRSLTDEGPRPLPTPPPGGFSGSEGEAVDGEGDTPKRTYRPRRSEMLVSAPATNEQGKGFKFPSTPSSANPNPAENLPDDAKTWTPFQLSEYLAMTLRVSSRNGNTGGAPLPDRVAQDIAKFVREKRISGRVFLRLSESDLEGYGINQLWRSTLLTASRSLRHSALKGRIWGPESSDTFEHEGGGDLSDVSTSSSVSSSSSYEKNGTTSERKTRHRQSSSAGRVKDMVDSLERSASVGKEHGNERENSRSTSPTKRALPSRGRVDSLFGPEETITQQRREPRMLPFPPAIVPHHTGPAHTHTHLYTPVNTLVPSHTGPAYPPSDYELGFRAPVLQFPRVPSGPLSPHPTDPTKQTFVVRHNPSPKQSTDADEPVKNPSSKRRLLPYPPIIGEAQLHHPRPTRREAVGLVSVEGFSSGESGACETVADDESSSTSVYETALDDEEEQTVEELLKHSQPVSGVAAWESMEMGDTVKRVPSDESEPGSGSAPGSAGNSKIVDVKIDDTPSNPSLEAETKLEQKTKAKFQTMEFGRKSGRQKVPFLTPELEDDEAPRSESVARRQGNGSVRENGLRRPGILGLFEDPAEQAPPSYDAAAGGEAGERKKALPAEPFPTDEPSSVVDPKEDHWHSRDSQFDTRELQLDLRQSQLDAREEGLNDRESRLDVDERALQERTRELGVVQTGVAEPRAEQDERGSSLDAREKVLDGRELGIVKREALLDERESRVAQRESKVVKREIEVDEKETGLGEKQLDVEGRSRLLDEREGKLAQLERERVGVEGGPTERKVSQTSSFTTLSLLRSCIRAAIVPVLGEDRVEGIFGTALPSPTAPAPASKTAEPDTSNTSTENLPAPTRASPINIRRDFFLARGGGLRVSYIVLMSIGMCAVVLRVLRFGMRRR